MDSNSFPLHRRPPSLQTQDQLLSDEYSDFPPIRERKSSEDPIRVPNHPGCYSSALPKRRRPPRSGSPSSQLPRRLRLPNAGLGSRNILNTREVTVGHAQNGSPKFLLKRRIESPSDDDGHPLKRYCLTSVYEKDMGWIMDELKDIKEFLNEIAGHLRGDVDLKIDRLQRTS